MDYPQLNLFFGFCLIVALVVNIGLKVLLSKLDLPGWMSFLSWVALVLSIFAALYIAFLFLRLMTPVFNWQFGLGSLLIGAIGALIIASLSRKDISPSVAGFLFGAQIIVSLVCLLLAYGLYRSLVPAPAV